LDIANPPRRQGQDISVRFLVHRDVRMPGIFRTIQLKIFNPYLCGKKSNSAQCNLSFMKNGIGFQKCGTRMIGG
jgi:hypothetical protein